MTAPDPDANPDLTMAGCHGLALRKAARLVSRFYDEKLAPTGLRSTQVSLLAVLNHRGEASVNELADALAMDRTTAGKNLLPLERAGYVEVAPSPTDHRSRHARLTAAGKVALAAARPYWMAAQAEFERHNGQEGAAALQRALSGLRVDA